MACKLQIIQDRLVEIANTPVGRSSGNKAKIDETINAVSNYLPKTMIDGKQEKIINRLGANTRSIVKEQEPKSGNGNTADVEDVDQPPFGADEVIDTTNEETAETDTGKNGKHPWLTEELYDEILKASDSNKQGQVLAGAKYKAGDPGTMTKEELARYNEDKANYGRLLTEAGIDLNNTNTVTEAAIKKLFGNNAAPKQTTSKSEPAIITAKELVTQANDIVDKIEQCKGQ